MTKKYNLSGISPEEFVKIWQSSKTLFEVSERMGLSKKIASARAGYYRSKGVPLKHFKKPIAWDALADLAEKTLKEAT